MNILFVTPAPPAEPADGARLIVHYLARELSKEHSLFICSLCDGASESADKKLRAWFTDVRLIQTPDVRRTSKWASNVGQGAPLWIQAYDVPALRHAIAALVKRRQIDVVHCDTGLMAQYADAVGELPRLVAPHDSLTRALREQARGAPHPMVRLAARWQIGKMRRYEAAAYARFARVLMVTERECDYLTQIAPWLDVRVTPNGVDAEYFAAQNILSTPDSLAFLGVMDYAPNQEAVFYFARDVLPRIWEQIPATTFTIIGRNPPRAVRELARDARVRVTGTVSDVRPALAAAAVFVCPLRAGGGIRNKVLEAMAMGKPVIATQEAADGINAADGEELFLADTAPELAAACVRLLRDESLRARLGDAARGWALKHTWRAAARAYEEQYIEIRAGELKVKG